MVGGEDGRGESLVVSSELELGNEIVWIGKGGMSEYMGGIN